MKQVIKPQACRPSNWPMYMDVEEEIDMFCEHGKLKVQSTTKDRIFKITTNLEYLPS